MAALEDNSRNRSSKSRHAKTCKVDLTPMVDLGFLLITFFILSTVLSQPSATKLVMPKDTSVKIPVKEGEVLTVDLVGNDSIAWYNGNWKNDLTPAHCALGNLRSVIQRRRQEVSKIFGDPAATVVIIYPGPECSYRNFIQALDEITINGVTRYFVVNAPSKDFTTIR